MLGDNRDDSLKKRTGCLETRVSIDLYKIGFKFIINKKIHSKKLEIKRLFLGVKMTE